RTATQLYSVALTHIEKNPDDRYVDTEEQAQAAQAPPRRARGPGSGAATPKGEQSDEDADTPRRGRGLGSATETNAKPEVKVEWDGLDRRIRQLTRLGGSVLTVAPSPDSKTYAFVAAGGDEDGGGRPALYTIADDGTRLTTVS